MTIKANYKIIVLPSEESKNDVKEFENLKESTNYLVNTQSSENKALCLPYMVRRKATYLQGMQPYQCKQFIFIVKEPPSLQSLVQSKQ